MDFGKLNPSIDSLDQVDLELPPLETRSLQFLGALNEFALANSSPMQNQVQSTRSLLTVGCPIWGQKEWIGKIYPEKTPAREFLKYYARRFMTVELNSSFYQLMDQKTIEQWCEQVIPEFKFCPKVFQGISHRPAGLSDRPLILSFFRSLEFFKDHLGVCFLQLPPTFSIDHFSILKRFINCIPSHLPVAIEFRHKSWFPNHALESKAFDLLSQFQIGTVVTDVSGRRDVLHSSFTSPSLLVRFNGNDLHSSDKERLKNWVMRLEELKAAGLKTVYFICHQPDDRIAPDTAQCLIHFWNHTQPESKIPWQDLPVEAQLAFF